MAHSSSSKLEGGGRVINRKLSKILTHLWNLDRNACIPKKDFKLNVKKIISREANEKLFQYFNEDILDLPTYARFCKLLNNYVANTDLPEYETFEEEQEKKDFLSAIMETRVMKEAHKYLVTKNKSPENVEAFKNQLYDLWFTLYKRDKTDKYVNSCGFEHVFVGEIRNENKANKVIGFHNWIHLYLQEKEGMLDYCGYYDDDISYDNGHYIEILTFKFYWKNVLKKRSTSFIGASPELEMAIYTIAFLCHSDEMCVKINGVDIELIVYSHGEGIGTAFPRCLTHGE